MLKWLRSKDRVPAFIPLDTANAKFRIEKGGHDDHVWQLYLVDRETMEDLGGLKIYYKTVEEAWDEMRRFKDWE